VILQTLSVCLLFSLSACAAGQIPDPASDSYGAAREQMVRSQLQARDIDHPAVLRAMREVPRHLFVPAAFRDQAYSDFPLPIGLNQTISQPYIVALMTQLADPKPNHRVLEIGTGSGYQAAVLSRIAAEVYTIEIIPELAERAWKTFSDLEYTNIQTHIGDGYRGWPEEAPFDRILITAAAPVIPDPLVEQLAENGRLVMPLGEPGWGQQLIVVEKKNGKLKQRKSIPVRFVPMTGEVQKMQ